MLLTNQNINTVEESNMETDGQVFKINACSQAFKILTDNLYEHKIPTIVRELSCNAYDSHVAANNLDTPFELKLPDSLDPNFYIRDFGTGLSEDDVINIYTTYFQSTKQESNDFIGAFGLGSKTPLCYAEQFNVTSYFNGLKYSYLVFINNKGFPEIQKINSEETEEKNGLRIQLAVKTSDIRDFEESCIEFFKYNNMKVSYKNVSSTFLKNVESVKPLYKYKNLEFFVRDYSSSGFFVKVGQVVYPLSSFPTSTVKKILTDYVLEFAPELNSASSFEKLENICNRYSNTFLLATVPIGSVEVSASREKLSLSEKSIQNLWSSICKSFVEMLQEQYTELEKIKTYLDAQKFAKDYSGEKFPPRCLLKKTWTFDELLTIQLDTTYPSKVEFKALKEKIKNLLEKSRIYGFQAQGESWFSAKNSDIYNSLENLGTDIVVGSLPVYYLSYINKLKRIPFVYVACRKKEVSTVVEKLKQELPEYIRIKTTEEYTFNMDTITLVKEKIKQGRGEGSQELEEIPLLKYTWNKKDCSYKEEEVLEFPKETVYYLRKTSKEKEKQIWSEVLKKYFDAPLYCPYKHQLKNFEKVVNLESEEMGKILKKLLLKSYKYSEIYDDFSSKLSLAKSVISEEDFEKLSKINSLLASKRLNGEYICKPQEAYSLNFEKRLEKLRKRILKKIENCIKKVSETGLGKEKFKELITTLLDELISSPWGMPSLSKILKDDVIKQQIYEELSKI